MDQGASLCAPQQHLQQELTSSGSGNLKYHKPAITIGMLVDDALIEIFDFCRKMHHKWIRWPPQPEWDWHILVHVCRRWRRIIFQSPRRLDLRILCTYRTAPVRENLGIWPAFPIDLELFSPETLEPKDEDNAIAALEHRDRVNSVKVFAHDSQLGRMAAVMQDPFPVLTCLDLRSCEETLVLTAAFLGGSAPHLQEITLYRISFPALPTLLLSTSDLVTLNLLDMPTLGYFSPERMVACLAALPRLKVFTITFPALSPRPDRIGPPPVTRLVLPALTSFEFRGSFKYLEDFVTQIDTPQLKQISIIYLDQLLGFQVTEASDFIDRSIGPGPSRHAKVYFRYNEITFTLSRHYETYAGWARRSVATTISLQVFGRPRLSEVARMLSQFSVVLGTVVYLQLDAELGIGAHSDAAYHVNWLHLMRQFPAVGALYVSRQLGTQVSLALEELTADMVSEVFPSLDLICLEGNPASSLEKIVAIFSDYPITVVETQDEFFESL